MPHEPLTDAEFIIVREGMDASDLLASDALKAVTKSLMVEAFAAITESLPDQLPQRENHYNLIRGLKAIEAELEARVQRRSSIERRLDAENASDTPDNYEIDDAELGVTE